jgi:hypothetical protein
MRHDTDCLRGTRRLECEEVIGQRRWSVTLDGSTRRRGGRNRRSAHSGKDDQVSELHVLTRELFVDASLRDTRRSSWTATDRPTAQLRGDPVDCQRLQPAWRMSMSGRVAATCAQTRHVLPCLPGSGGDIRRRLNELRGRSGFGTRLAHIGALGELPIPKAQNPNPKQRYESDLRWDLELGPWDLALSRSYPRKKR